MEKNHPVSELMAETIEKIKEAVDANTVVGEPIVAGEITLIPVSKISLGFGTGGSEMGGKTPKVMGENPFGGGGGGALSITPIAFLTVSGENVKLITIDRNETSVDKALAMAPEMVDKVASTVANLFNKESDKE